jgi:hypothetical protein
VSAVVRVDCEKELVGDYANGGREWEPEGSPTRVGTHDFPDPEMGKAIPYGVLDVGANEGWVNVGDDHTTPRPSQSPPSPAGGNAWATSATPTPPG